MCVREVYGFCSGKVSVECKIGVAVIRKLCFAFPLIEVNGEILKSVNAKLGTEIIMCDTLQGSSFKHGDSANL